MDLTIIFEIIKEYGYIGLFLWLWLGMFGIPVPNEVFVSSVGIVAQKGLLETSPALITIYLGVIASLTTCYFLGRFLGKGVYSKLEKHDKMEASFEKGEKLLNKYHAYALCISYFLPGVRNVVPFLAGFMKLPYYQFAIAAYTSAILWVTTFFFMGRLVWNYLQLFVVYRLELQIAASVFIVLYFAYERYKKQNDPSFIFQKYR
ncbi:DedA family protein [Bacillus sp. RO2]|uniref:DedA family protein n=1 Tax=Bacillus sp. RO2 TaxID=2723913 RepID=UPI00145D9DAC|nr:DedA family protein [Bacillus sp. RO2]NMH71590.1 DedA family protein [Bacillus sp. RO2]